MQTGDSSPDEVPVDPNRGAWEQVEVAKAQLLAIETLGDIYDGPVPPRYSNMDEEDYLDWRR